MRDEPNRMLDFLTAKPKPAGDACRSNPRRRSTVKIELAWSDGKSWRAIPARLRDISRDGAGLIARSSPPPTKLARLRMTEGEGTPWIEAAILGVEPETPTRFRIRLQFAEPCPNFLLRMAVLDGIEPDDVPVARQRWSAWNSLRTD